MFVTVPVCRRFDTLRLSVAVTTVLLALVVALPGAHAAVQAELPLREAQTLFRRANEQYQKQNYPEARNLYLQIVQGGVRSPEVYYNLANSAARLGRVGEAVLYYERARELAPRDRDISANLQRVAPPGNDPDPFVLAVPFHWLLNRYSVSEWMGAFLVLFLATGIFGAALLAKRLPAGLALPARVTLLVAAMLTLVCGVFAGTRYFRASVPRVITMRPEAVIRSGPSENYSQIVAVPEGTKLRRRTFTDDPLWARVTLPTGQTGYTLARNLQQI